MVPVAEVVVGEGVDESFALVAADGLLVADGSRPAAVVLEVPGGGPAGSPGVALEVGENRAGRQAGPRGPGHVRMVAAADQEVEVVAVTVNSGEVSVPGCRRRRGSCWPAGPR